MAKKLKLKTLIMMMLSLFCIVFTNDTFAEGGKPITSWKDIVIGKTTEEEIIAGNPEGAVYLSVQELPALTKGLAVPRTLRYGSKHSYTEEKRIYDQMFEIPEFKDHPKGLELIMPEPKLEDYLKPALLNNGPIDLRWNKLGKAELEISSNGLVLGWVMKYWFFDPSNQDSYHANYKKKLYPNKEEILEIFEAELGKPQKILKPEAQVDEYLFSFNKREIRLKLLYAFENKVVLMEFKEGQSIEELISKTVNLMVESLSSIDLDKQAKEAADFVHQHKDFEQVRPIIYKLSLDPKNMGLSLQELYDMAKKQIKDQ